MKFRIALVVIGIVAMMAGCSKKEDTTVVSSDENSVTVTGEEGTATMEYGEAALPADLGLTLYPGATVGAVSYTHLTLPTNREV